jgi:exonuclease III
MKYQNFKKSGLHIIHLNINSILSKLEQLRIIAFKTNAAIIGLSESKLDKTVTDAEISINGYKLLRTDRNRHGGGVACYVRTDLFFNKRDNFSTETENLFFDIFLPKTKPILVGILYIPPDQSVFL